MGTADRGGAPDARCQNQRGATEPTGGGDGGKRSALGYSSSRKKKTKKRSSQLMPATRDELFTHLSNQ